MTSRVIDSRSASYTELRVIERADLLDVGTGAALAAAVIAAEGHGTPVVLGNETSIMLVTVGTLCREIPDARTIPEVEMPAGLRGGTDIGSKGCIRKLIIAV